MKINTGTIRIPIERDNVMVGEIEVNPEDVVFAEKFYGLINELKAKEQEYGERLKGLENSNEVDEYGFPKSAETLIKISREICEYMRKRIDDVFGLGTSDIVFGKANTLDMFSQFFNGLTPYVTNAREKKIGKYLGNRASRRAVMK
ncbi:MAG TPA: hypothetical protein GXX54_08930 [Clostridiales bacterium]|nr:hypothetical protein [Clostridiales bacterium]